MSVFDRESRLVAWNDRFVDLLELPGWLTQPGAGFADYLRYRIDRGDFGAETPAAMATQQEQIRCRQGWKSEQVLANGTVLEVRRDPMPDGGFVTTYTDVTELKVAARQLREAKEWLERRVAERTGELTAVNDKLREEIYERAQVEDALQIAKAEAETANLSKTRFFAGASHDLLQPLNAARLFITARTECSLGRKEREFAGQIDQALCNVEALLGTLLDISKLDAGAVIPKCKDFIIGDLLRGLAEEFKPVAADAGLDLILVPSSAAVRSDPVLLSRVIRNLLANAIRYTAVGRVLLGCRRRGKVVRIEVCDSGIGIPESATQQVFEEFRQLSTSGEARGKGVGLGLAIVKRLSRVLGHPIGARSTVGIGSAFFVDVPIGSLHDAHGRIQTARRTPVHALASAFIVIIEDHDAVRDGMRELLQSWGCRTITAAERHRALGELAQAGRPPDMVIADYHLDRGATGLAAVAAVRAVHGPVPALIITADRSREVLDEIRHHGIHSLQKPVKPAKLRALVSHLLAQRRPGKAEAGREPSLQPKDRHGL